MKERFGDDERVYVYQAAIRAGIAERAAQILEAESILFDQNAAPEEDDIPIVSVPMMLDKDGEHRATVLNFMPMGMFFATAIGVGISSTLEKFVPSDMPANYTLLCLYKS